MSDLRVMIQPLVRGIPKEPVKVGGQFTIELGLRVPDPSTWPYQDDSFVIGVMASGRGIIVYAVDGMNVVLHRDGTSTTMEMDVELNFIQPDNSIFISLISQGGVPFHVFAVEFPTES